MSESEYKIIGGHKTLIVCFGGIALKFGGILPFEFLKYLSSTFLDRCDLHFFVDKKQCWYHKGIQGITNNIDETVLYINDVIKNGNYERVLFMGISAGGYAAILFGSLCNNVNNVISFIPQTIINKPINSNYSNLENIININTSYLLYGSKMGQNLHHFSHCKNLKHFKNVKIIEVETLDIKELRDNGHIKTLIESVI
jgi:hypothetical protein